jgi:hypothetical protein
VFVSIHLELFILSIVDISQLEMVDMYTDFVFCKVIKCIQETFWNLECRATDKIAYSIDGGGAGGVE